MNINKIMNINNTIENNIEDNNTIKNDIEDNNTVNIKKVKIMNCRKCKIEIAKKMGTNKLCKKCNNEITKNFYHTKVRPLKKIIKNKTYEKEIIENNKVIKINISKETKKCNICNNEKDYNDFHYINCKYKGIIKHYLAPNCKTCIKLLYENKKQIFNEIISKMKSCNINDYNELINNNNNTINKDYDKLINNNTVNNDYNDQINNNKDYNELINNNNINLTTVC